MEMWSWARMDQQDDDWTRLPQENVQRLQNTRPNSKDSPPLHQFNVTLPQFFLGVANRNDDIPSIYFSVLILSPIAPSSSPYSLTRIVLQSTLVARDACVFSCATMVFIHIIQRPQRLFYNFCTGWN